MPSIFSRCSSLLHQCLPPLRLLQRCLICAAQLHSGRRLCHDCEAALPWLPPGCLRCGRRDESLAPGRSVCDHCQQSPPDFDRCLALFEYRPPASVLISRFKYRHALAEGHALGQLLNEGFGRHYSDSGEIEPDCLLPVPLHHWRLRQRGFNQAVLLARQIARSRHITLDLHSVYRARHHRAQQGQNRRQRQQNVSSLFQLSTRHQLQHYRHIAIIDDVVTTGATGNALARTLRQASDARIDLWCLASVP